MMPDSNNPDNNPDQSLVEHLRELRSCLLVSLVAVAVMAAAAYAFIEPISHWLFQPLVGVLPKSGGLGGALIFTSYQEGFFFISSWPWSAA
jgi:sec-independent protein translocase protein TatC